MRQVEIEIKEIGDSLRLVKKRLETHGDWGIEQNKEF